MSEQSSGEDDVQIVCAKKRKETMQKPDRGPDLAKNGRNRIFKNYLSFRNPTKWGELKALQKEQKALKIETNHFQKQRQNKNGQFQKTFQGFQ